MGNCAYSSQFTQNPNFEENRITDSVFWMYVQNEPLGNRRENAFSGSLGTAAVTRIGVDGKNVLRLPESATVLESDICVLCYGGKPIDPRKNALAPFCQKAGQGLWMRFLFAGIKPL